MHPALGLVEFNSVAAGVHACDEMVKVAPVELIDSRPICPGKYISVVGGEVAPVETSVAMGVEIGADSVVDSLLIPNIHEQVFPAILGTSNVSELETLGIIETFSVASGIVAGDVAAKAAAITLIEIRLARGLGGKSFITLSGFIADVEAAVSAGSKAISNEGMLVRDVVIPNPRHDLDTYLL
ncbi:MAG: BMC domain-containing protein [Planctomycetes bacterium]|nr:BMC domain-containing protein [Planctomycetota bacterium]